MILLLVLVTGTLGLVPVLNLVLGCTRV
eukprot:SAG11_NODE_50185_length_121_cov_1.437500_1_plen_27_part_10